MATHGSKRKLTASNKTNCEEHPRNNMAQNSNVPRSREDYITQVSEEIEWRVTEMLSQEFSRTENRILCALARLDDFLMNPLIQGHSGTAPETFRNALSTSQGTNEDDSQSDPHPEAGIFHNQMTQNSGPEDGHYNLLKIEALYSKIKSKDSIFVQMNKFFFSGFADSLCLGKMYSNYSVWFNNCSNLQNSWIPNRHFFSFTSFVKSVLSRRQTCLKAYKLSFSLFLFALRKLCRDWPTAQFWAPKWTKMFLRSNSFFLLRLLSSVCPSYFVWLNN